MVTMRAVHEAAGSREVTLEMVDAPGHVVTEGALYLGGTPFKSPILVSPSAPATLSVPKRPVEFRGQTAGNAGYTLRAKEAGQVVSKTAGTAPDFFTLVF